MPIHVSIEPVPGDLIMATLFIASGENDGGSIPIGKKTMVLGRDEALLAQLADQGNTVVVIEHNMDVIKCADWLIDLGPEGGDRGGMVVAQGTPEQVAATPGSYTGDYLKRHLGASLSAAGDGLRTPTRVAV